MAKKTLEVVQVALTPTHRVHLTFQSPIGPIHAYLNPVEARQLAAEISTMAYRGQEAAADAYFADQEQSSDADAELARIGGLFLTGRLDRYLEAKETHRG